MNVQGISIPKPLEQILVSLAIVFFAEQVTECPAKGQILVGNGF